MLLGDAVHNFGDGLLLSPAFAVDVHLGIIATLGILVHEFVQEVSEFFVLREAGYSTKQALIRNFLISTTILGGAALGYFAASFQKLVGPILGLAAGALLYVVFRDLIPRSIKAYKNDRKRLKHIGMAILGAIIILVLNSLVEGL